MTVPHPPGTGSHRSGDDLAADESLADAVLARACAIYARDGREVSFPRLLGFAMRHVLGSPEPPTAQLRIVGELLGARGVAEQALDSSHWQLTLRARWQALSGPEPDWTVRPPGPDAAPWKAVARRAELRRLVPAACESDPERALLFAAEPACGSLDAARELVRSLPEGVDRVAAARLLAAMPEESVSPQAAVTVLLGTLREA